MEKRRPWEGKAKIGETTPCESLGGIMGLVYLRCFPGVGRPEPVPDGALGPRDGRGCFCVGLWSRAGIRSWLDCSSSYPKRSQPVNLGDSVLLFSSTGNPLSLETS